jgi:hypothetical protein
MIIVLCYSELIIDIQRLYSIFRPLPTYEKEQHNTAQTDEVGSSSISFDFYVGSVTFGSGLGRLVFWLSFTWFSSVLLVVEE